MITQATNGRQWTGAFTVGEVTVTEKGLVFGLASTGTFTLIVNNQRPKLSVAPSTVRAQPGETVSATVTATDPDGDAITLTKVSGPGEFSAVRSRGSASGTYTWTVPDPYWGSGWQLVGFRAEDDHGWADLAYLLVRISVLPRPYGGSAWVNRGATAMTTVYIHDPDSFSHSFSFHPPSGIRVRVAGQQEPRDYEGAWGGLYYDIEVTADRALCPGTYAVPFSVTDPDGNSGQATLTVYVRGNQPPQASPPHLRGETTVTLTPAGAVYSPVVMTVPRIWDPDGDTVYVEGYGLPPTYAANVSLLLGSLVAMYWPDGADGFCRAVRERDVIVDEFTVILRDPCRRGLDAGGGRWATLQRARVARNTVAEGPREGYPAAGPGRRSG